MWDRPRRCVLEVRDRYAGTSVTVVSLYPRAHNVEKRSKPPCFFCDVLLFKAALEALSNVQEVNILHYTGHNTAGKLWQVQFMKQGGHHYSVTASGRGDDGIDYLYPTQIPVTTTLEEASQLCCSFHFPAAAAEVAGW